MTVWTSLLGWFRYSLYLALSCDSLEEVVHSELWDKFYLCKTECFSWNKWNECEPGLFKSEFKGTRVIALCRKFYFAKNEKGEKVKLSSKGVQQHRIKLHWDWCKAALEGGVDTTTNRGMRMNGGVMSTYEQDKLGLSAHYDKRCVLEDGIDTKPPVYHIGEEEPWEQELWDGLWDGRQLGVDRLDKKFLTNKATLGAVVQMIPNRFIGLGNVFSWCGSFRLERICGSFPSTFKFAGRTDSSQPPRRGSIFHKPWQVCWKKLQAWNKRPFLW